MKGVVHRGRDRDFIEFNEQIIMLIDAKSRSALTQSVQVFRIKVKVASGGQLQPVAKFTLQPITQPLYFGIVEPILTAAMRRSHHVGNPVSDSRLSHAQRLFDRGGTVVHSRQYMAMKSHD